MTREEAIEKIGKLLAVSKDSAATEGEVANALSSAQRLMAQFRVAELEIGPCEEEPVHRELESPTQRPTALFQSFAAAISRHFRCKCYIRGGRSLFLVGLPEDTRICADAIDYSYRAFRSLSEKFCEAVGAKGRSEKIRTKNSYGLGFLQGLEKGFRENESEYALVLVTPECVTKEFSGMRMSPAPRRRILCGNFDAASAQGSADGEAVAKSKGKWIEGGR